MNVTPLRSQENRLGICTFSQWKDPGMRKASDAAQQNQSIKSRLPGIRRYESSASDADCLTDTVTGNLKREKDSCLHFEAGEPCGQNDIPTRYEQCVGAGKRHLFNDVFTFHHDNNFLSPLTSEIDAWQDKEGK
jgi:hypothetical protein